MTRNKRIGYTGWLVAFIATTFCLTTSSCKKFIEVQPPVTSINTDNVYNSDATATAVLTSMYAQMSANGLFNMDMTSISLFGGLSSDELSLYDTQGDARLISYFKNDLSSTTFGGEYWNLMYSYIYRCNAAIQGLSYSKGLTATIKDQLTGEAKFLRAFFYFYLTNFYGDLPLVLTTDYKVNSNIGRSPTTAIYDQIVNDLLEATNLLNKNYVAGNITTITEERVRPNFWAAKALLARVYLFKQDYDNANKIASEVIENTGMYTIVGLNEVVLKNSMESIWQLQPVNNGWNTEEARAFVLPPIGPNDFDHPVFITQTLLDAFEPNDQRALNWIGKFSDTVTYPDIDYYYPNKYKSATQDNPVTEASTVLRLGEQYLIRAEARVKLGDPQGAIDDLNVIRIRAGLPITSASSDIDIFNAIMKERQVELFSEWGHRWLDLKRNNLADLVLKNIKGTTWQATDVLYPIPQSEILANPSLLNSQNPGY